MSFLLVYPGAQQAYARMRLFIRGEPERRFAVVAHSPRELVFLREQIRDAHANGVAQMRVKHLWSETDGQVTIERWDINGRCGDVRIHFVQESRSHLYVAHALDGAWTIGARPATLLDWVYPCLSDNGGWLVETVIGIKDRVGR